LPEVLVAAQKGFTTLTWSFLLMWFFGEIFNFIYVFTKNKEMNILPLLGINILNIMFILILFWYK